MTPRGQKMTNYDGKVGRGSCTACHNIIYEFRCRYQRPPLPKKNSFAKNEDVIYEQPPIIIIIIVTIVIMMTICSLYNSLSGPGLHHPDPLR